MIRLFLFPDQYFDIFCYIYKSSLFEWLLMNFICQILDKMKKGRLHKENCKPASINSFCLINISIY